MAFCLNVLFERYGASRTVFPRTLGLPSRHPIADFGKSQQHRVPNFLIPACYLQILSKTIVCTRPKSCTTFRAEVPETLKPAMSTKHARKPSMSIATATLYKFYR